MQAAFVFMGMIVPVLMAVRRAVGMIVTMAVMIIRHRLQLQEGI
jgi:hypothetical protein